MRMMIGKRGDMPYWLVMMIYILASLVVILLLIMLAGGSLQDSLSWLEGLI